uniref:Solute carrier family 35 member F4 n=1 Tax=Cyprinodon variegatus TaxID=28743 RepID=A0A3Q2DJG8_CYPVA
MIQSALPLHLDVPKVAANGVHDIEDRILRITGYYGYNPGYSSHRRKRSPDDHLSSTQHSETAGQNALCGASVEGREDWWGQSRPETPGSETSIEIRSYQTCANTVLKVLGGLLMLLCVSSSWVGTTQVVKLTFQSFSCPFFISWFSSNWNILFFPIYYSGHFFTAGEKQTPIQKFRECSKLFGEDGMTLKLFVKRTAPFSILWTLTNYLYLLALKKLTATDVSALFCSFVFLLSWIVLKDRFMGVRIVAAIMAITGIVMMAYADGFHGDSFVGVALAVGSASTSALYKVLFKMFLGSANLGEVAHFFSTMGFFNLIFISCVPLILYFTKVEHLGSLSSLPWGYLFGLAGLWLVFNILVHVGVVLTYPILISIGTLLSVPGNAAVDVLKHEVIFSVVRLTATCIICLGFLLLLLPEEWDSVTLRFLANIADKKSEEHGEELTESSGQTRSRSRANGAISIPLA